MLGRRTFTGRRVDLTHVVLNCREVILRILHGGSRPLTLTMPDPEPVQQQ